jgi:hypothetical protein
MPGNEAKASIDRAENKGRDHAEECQPPSPIGKPVTRGTAFVIER